MFKRHVPSFATKEMSKYLLNVFSDEFFPISLARDINIFSPPMYYSFMKII